MGDRTKAAVKPARLLIVFLLFVTFGCAHSGLVAQPGTAPLPPAPAQLLIQGAVVNTSVGAMVASMDTGTLATVGPQMATYASNHHFHTIFLYLSWNDTHTNLPKGDPATVAALNQLASAATIYIITGNRNWQLTPTVVPTTVQDTVTAARTYSQFKGIVYDLEPQALPGWKTSRQATITQYVQFLTTLLVNPGGYSVKTTIVAVAPYYGKLANSLGTTSPSLLQQVQSLANVNGLYVMDFVSPESLQEKGATPLALSQIQKPFWWGSTCDAGAPAGVSYHGTPASMFISEMSTLQSFLQSRNANYQSLFAHAWNTENTSLQTVLP